MNVVNDWNEVIGVSKIGVKNDACVHCCDNCCYHDRHVEIVHIVVAAVAVAVAAVVFVVAAVEIVVDVFVVVVVVAAVVFFERQHFFWPLLLHDFDEFFPVVLL